MSPESSLNTRILVIDDEESVRESFQSVLQPEDDSHGARVASAAAALFGPVRAEEPSVTGHLVSFELDVAKNGIEGVERVRQAVADKRPYAVIFCDIRMPGMDGVETVERIREHDPRVEVVFVTAYSDHSIDEICQRAGANVGYFVKPFISDEVRQLSTKLILDWNRARELEQLMVRLSSLGDSADDVQWMLEFMLRQICVWLNTDSAALLSATADNRYAFRAGIGNLNSDDSAELLLREMLKSQPPSEEISKVADWTVLPMRHYGLAVALTGQQRVTPDREFLLRVFVEHASLALRHAQAREDANRDRRLAGLGQAIGFLLHDLRAPIGVARMRSELVEEQLGEQNASALDNLAHVQSNLDKSLGMLEDVMHYLAGETSLSLSVVDLAVSLRDLMEEWEWVLKKRDGIAFGFEIPAGIEMEVDLKRLRRCLVNLINNSAQVLHGRADPRIDLRVEQRGSDVRLRLSDNGPGMPENMVEDMFLPFSTSNTGQGAGFGLAIVRQVAEAHGGNVRIIPTAMGACVEIQLPLHARPVSDVAPKVHPVTAASTVS